MPSFDVVCTVDEQEVRNAVDQTSRELGTRWDFKGSKSKIELQDTNITIEADDQMKLTAVQDILKQKLAKRSISLKSVEFEEPQKAGGDILKQIVKVKQGLTDPEMKKINKSIKAQKMKVSSQIQGDQLRVTGKKRDDLQSVIAFLKSEISELDLQFVNFRD